MGIPWISGVCERAEASCAPDAPAPRELRGKGPAEALPTSPPRSAIRGDPGGWRLRFVRGGIRLRPVAAAGAHGAPRQRGRLGSYAKSSPLANSGRDSRPPLPARGVGILGLYPEIWNMSRKNSVNRNKQGATAGSGRRRQSDPRTRRLFVAYQINRWDCSQYRDVCALSRLRERAGARGGAAGRAGWEGPSSQGELRSSAALRTTFSRKREKEAPRNMLPLPLAGEGAKV